jgi:hypothetical protein
MTPAALSVKVTARISNGSSAAQDLVRDPARDRRRLARAGAGEDAGRPAHGFDGDALLRGQSLEHVRGSS